MKNILLQLSRIKVKVFKKQNQKKNILQNKMANLFRVQEKLQYTV
jgi:hypothetical protein